MTLNWVQQTSTFVVGDERPLPIWNADGVPWHEAPLPPRRHKCQPQTTGLLDDMIVNRCACGGLQSPQKYPRLWITRNSRTPSVDEYRARMLHSIRWGWRCYALATAFVIVVVPWRLGWGGVAVCVWMVMWCAWARFWLWAAPWLARQREHEGITPGLREIPGGDITWDDVETPLASIVCPRCGRRSYNPHDIEQGYCGFCHWWTSDILLKNYQPALPDDVATREGEPANDLETS